MLAARRSPACAHVDAAHRSLVGNLSSLDVSHRAARANIGDVSRLRWHLRRCVAGTPATRSTLRVLAIGCSMTQGQMNCGGKLEGRQCGRPCAKLRWATVLQRMLQAALPACDVEVLLQTSKGGRTIVAAARFDTRILKYRPHVVITDLTVCDLRGVSSSLDAYRLQAGWETLLRKLLSVPPSLSDTAGAADQGSPAIVHLESWDRFSPMGGCRNASGRIHHEVSVFYRVPVVSFMLGVCAHDPATAPARHWLAGCSDGAMQCVRLDTPGAQCEPHPGPHVHRLFAMLLAERITQEALRACTAAVRPWRPRKAGGGGGGGGSTGSGSTGGGGGGWAALPAPPTTLPADAPTLLPASALAGMSGCRMKHGVSNPTLTLDFGTACGSPAPPAAHGWRCYEDRPGKLGWVAAGGAASTGTLSFEASAIELPAGGKLTVAYLRSYEGMGRARLWLDDDHDRALTLNGTWAAPTSQTDLAIVGVSALCGPSCLVRRQQQARHRIRLKRLPAEGGGKPGKFKLLLLELC